MTPKPFFSIVIPTKGRPQLLRDALKSALWQDFDDFEVVVSDNYNDNQTQAVLNDFKDDSRLQCVRTDRLLNMPEHWDFATQHANGQYVLILTDRSVLKQGALKTIQEEILSSEKPVEACSWRWSIYDDNAGCESANQQVLHERDVHWISSVQLLEDFASGYSHYNKCLPRGLNSCYRGSFIKQIRDEFGSPFRPLSPDYFLAFTTLGIVREVLFIDQPLFISQGLDVSNGTRAFKGKGTAGGNYLKSLGEIDLYAHVPIKASFCYNLVYEDFLAAREMIGGNLDNVPPDWPGYFMYCYSELLSKEAWGHMSQDLLKNLFNEWERALSTFDEATQIATKEKVEALSQTSPSGQKIESNQKNNLTSLNIDRLKDFINRLVNPFRNGVKEKIVSQEKKRGLSALELAGF